MYKAKERNVGLFLSAYSYLIPFEKPLIPGRTVTFQAVNWLAHKGLEPKYPECHGLRSGHQIWASDRQKSNPGLNIFEFVSSQAGNSRRLLQLTNCCSKRRNQWEQLGTDEQRLRVCSTLFRALSSSLDPKMCQFCMRQFISVAQEHVCLGV